MTSILAKTRASRDTQVLFISTDSGLDPTEPLRDYVTRFHDGFIGASGSRATIEQLTEEMTTAFRLPEQSPAANQAQSRGPIRLIGPDSLLRAEFFPPYNAESLTAAYLRIRFCHRHQDSGIFPAGVK
jgi:cytochrome oxidase Cu insertion factor (SCO1/SenC/PrrC family)